MHDGLVFGDLRYTRTYGFMPLWGMRLAPDGTPGWTDARADTLGTLAGLIDQALGRGVAFVPIQEARDP